MAQAFYECGYVVNYGKQKKHHSTNEDLVYTNGHRFSIVHKQTDLQQRTVFPLQNCPNNWTPKDETDVSEIYLDDQTVRIGSLYVPKSVLTAIATSKAKTYPFEKQAYLLSIANMASVPSNSMLETANSTSHCHKLLASHILQFFSVGVSEEQTDHKHYVRGHILPFSHIDSNSAIYKILSKLTVQNMVIISRTEWNNKDKHQKFFVCLQVKGTYRPNLIRQLDKRDLGPDFYQCNKFQAISKKDLQTLEDGVIDRFQKLVSCKSI